MTSVKLIRNTGAKYHERTTLEFSFPVDVCRLKSTTAKMTSIFSRVKSSKLALKLHILQSEFAGLFVKQANEHVIVTSSLRC
jgi:hypothetical protein